MKYTIYDEGEIIFALLNKKEYKRLEQNPFIKIFEQCDEDQLKDKVAYWQHICYPKPERDLKYVYRKGNWTLYSIYPDENKKSKFKDYE